MTTGIIGNSMPIDYKAIRQIGDLLSKRLVENGAERAVIAGSFRRNKPEPHDLELVVQVRTVTKLKDTDLFGTDSAEYVTAWSTAGIDEWILGMISAAVPAFDYDRENPKNGVRYKRFILNEILVPGRYPFELWFCDESNFGNTLTIRTGDEDFTNLLVTPWRHKGLMPDYLVQMQGRLWEYPSWEDAQAAREAKKPGLGVAIPCPTEEAYFEALGIAVPDPHERTEATAKSLCYSPR